MYRIKTTTETGAEFLSPFVFTEDQAEKKIKSIVKWHTWQGWPKFELVSVDKYHKLAVWKEQHPIFIPMVSESGEMLKHLENTWEKEK